MPSLMQNIAGRGLLTRYLMCNFLVTTKNSMLHSLSIIASTSIQREIINIMHMCDAMRINTSRERERERHVCWTLRDQFSRERNFSRKKTFPATTISVDKMNISRYFVREKKFPTVPTSLNAIATRSEGLFVVSYFPTVRFRSSPGR